MRMLIHHASARSGRTGRLTRRWWGRLGCLAAMAIMAASSVCVLAATPDRGAGVSDEIEMTTKVTKLTARRIYFRIELVNIQESRVVVVAALVVTAFDKNYKPTRIPDFIVGAITGKKG